MHQSNLHVCLSCGNSTSLEVSSWGVHSYKYCLCVNLLCTLRCTSYCTCLWHCMCYVRLCVWREPTVSRLSDYLNNLSLLSFLSLNPRWGCSSGTQQDKSASGASFPVIYGTPLWLWWSTTLQVSVPHEIFSYLHSPNSFSIYIYLHLFTSTILKFSFFTCSLLTQVARVHLSPMSLGQKLYCLLLWNVWQMDFPESRGK